MSRMRIAMVIVRIAMMIMMIAIVMITIMYTVRQSFDIRRGPKER